MELITNSANYHINVEVFEGPLDLLLHLIKKNDMDIYDIPMALVLEEYMKYLDTLKELDIDLAGEFLLMAAELTHIKSRMLLPEDPKAEEEEEEDPRSDLIRRLLEYQQFKEAGESLMSRTILHRDVFVPQSPERAETPSDGPIEGNIYDLVEVFSKILKRVPADKFHEVATDRISINDRIYEIIALVKKGRTVTIAELLPENITRYDVVITFLSLLEMCRLRMLRIYQTEAHGNLYLQGLMDEVKEEEIAELIEIEATGFDKKEPEREV